VTACLTNVEYYWKTLHRESKTVTIVASDTSFAANKSAIVVFMSTIVMKNMTIVYYHTTIAAYKMTIVSTKSTIVTYVATLARAWAITGAKTHALASVATTHFRPREVSGPAQPSSPPLFKVRGHDLATQPCRKIFLAIGIMHG
jgi:hypothetical protein